MSIASMADGRIQRERDREGRVESGATQAEITPLKGLTDFARYIPTEAIGAYTAILAGAFDPLHASGSQKPSDLDYSDRWWLLFWSCVGTAGLVWLIYKAKTRTGAYKKGRRDVPVFEMAVAVVALIVWASAFPDTPFAYFSWYGDWFPPFILPFAAVVIALVAAAFGRTPPKYEVGDQAAHAAPGAALPAEVRR